MVSFIHFERSETESVVDLDDANGDLRVKHYSQLQSMIWPVDLMAGRARWLGIERPPCMHAMQPI